MPCLPSIYQKQISISCLNLPSLLPLLTLMWSLGDWRLTTHALTHRRSALFFALLVFCPWLPFQKVNKRNHFLLCLLHGVLGGFLGPLPTGQDLQTLGRNTLLLEGMLFATFCQPGLHTCCKESWEIQCLLQDVL